MASEDTAGTNDLRSRGSSNPSTCAAERRKRTQQPLPRPDRRTTEPVIAELGLLLVADRLLERHRRLRRALDRLLKHPLQSLAEAQKLREVA
jgi:hypothetical protein